MHCAKEDLAYDLHRLQTGIALCPARPPPDQHGFLLLNAAPRAGYWELAAFSTAGRVPSCRNFREGVARSTLRGTLTEALLPSLVACICCSAWVGVF